MAAPLATVVALVLACQLGQGGASSKLRAVARPATELVSAEAVEERLLGELASAVGHARGGRESSKLAKLEGLLEPMYASLPKNEHGRLGHAAARYALHRLFVSRHAWFVKGLEPEISAQSAQSPVSMLKDRVPSYVESLFEERLGTRGLGLHELAVLAATLEHLVHDEMIERLRATYEAHSLALAEPVDEGEAVDAIIDTYMMAYITGANLTAMTTESVVAEQAMFAKDFPGWVETKMWARDVRGSVAYAEDSHANPLNNGKMSFADVANVIETIGDKYGRWQDLECRSMKQLLLEFEDKDSGRVRLSTFYGTQLDGQLPPQFAFTESPAFLRSIGALDETDPNQPSVIIANYITSPSNCLASSDFYTVCCMDECESLLGHVEREIKAPTASTERIAAVVANLSSDTVDAPRQLSAPLLRRLDEIASHHGGEVPLHGRLFAQWMHHAYPRECTFPQAAESRTMDGAVFEETTLATVGEMRQHAARNGVAEEMYMRSAGAEAPVELPWSTSEELFAHHAAPTASSKLGAAFRSVMPLALLASAGLALLQVFRASVASSAGGATVKRRAAWDLPLHLGARDKRQD